ncbi:MAG: DUF5615 family PIN-like protein [Deltaproteobacteria bacterium]|nr:DUF5615 family PIN-like protein [Deltaproteobacteria bacterium]
MRLLLDMNLSPGWVEALAARGFAATHWSSVGDPRAPDAQLMWYAREGGYVVFTHDLDFGALLALTRADGPSVLQLRTQDVTPQAAAALVHRVLIAHAEALRVGALVTVDARTSRVRILPVR